MINERKNEIWEALEALPTQTHRTVILLCTLGLPMPGMETAEVNKYLLEAIPLLGKKGITQLEFGDFVRSLSMAELTQLGVSLPPHD